MVVGQESILSMDFSPSILQVAPGQSADLRLTFNNKSVYAADDIAVSILDTQGFTLAPSEVTIKVIPAYGKSTLDLELICPAGVAEGRTNIALQIIYTYCVDVSCFQIINQLSIPVVVSEAGAAPIPVMRQISIPEWVWPAVGGFLLAISGLLWKRAKTQAPIYIVLALFVVGGLTYGIILDQHEQAQGIAAVLCTSCVGIEESKHEPPTLSENTVAALAKLDTDVELVVFYAPWCHTCPYAKEMVKNMAEVNQHISYRFVNVDENREATADSGIIRNQRTVVPAVLQVDSGEVIFGVEDLEMRLLQLMGVTI
jgi:thiol-disulfide isomerase/thioredoxin